MQETLDEGVRLGVLEELKGRLRAEIWGQSGPNRDEREVEEKSGKVTRRGDSPMERHDSFDEERTVERFVMGPGRRVVVEWREEKKDGAV